MYEEQDNNVDTLYSHYEFVKQSNENEISKYVLLTSNEK